MSTSVVSDSVRAWERAASLSACFGSAAQESRARELAHLADLSADQFRTAPRPGANARPHTLAQAARRRAAAAHACSSAAARYAIESIKDVNAAAPYKYLEAHPDLIDRYHTVCMFADSAASAKDDAIREAKSAIRAALAGDARTASACLRRTVEAERRAVHSALLAQERFYTCHTAAEEVAP